MEKSETIGELAKALCLAQADIMKAHKDSRNPFFKSKYADLESVWDAIRVPLTTNGLSVTQFPTGDNQLCSMLMHTSGEWMMSTFSMRPVKDDPQGRGSCITYMRRYALQAIVGVCPHDDDGNAASTRSLSQETYNGTVSQRIAFAKACEKIGITGKESMVALSDKLIGKTTVGELPAAIKKINGEA